MVQLLEDIIKNQNILKKSLNNLFEWTRYTYNNLKSLSDKILLSSLFFYEFLDIHPFSNGNGRTARILLNLLLQNDMSIPFSLYLRCDNKGRDDYLQVIESCYYNSPSELASYILCSSYRFIKIK